MDESAPRLDVENDEAISDSAILYRRIYDIGSTSWIVVDQVTGERRPCSGAFMPDDDGLSVYLGSVLADQGLGPEDLVRNPMNGVVSLGVSDVRGLELGVVADPWPATTDEKPHLRDAAHALVKGLESLGKKRQHRMRQTLASTANFVYPPE